LPQTFVYEGLWFLHREETKMIVDIQN